MFKNFRETDYTENSCIKFFSVKQSTIKLLKIREIILFQVLDFRPNKIFFVKSVKSFLICKLIMLQDPPNEGENLSKSYYSNAKNMFEHISLLSSILLLSGGWNKIMVFLVIYYFLLGQKGMILKKPLALHNHEKWQENSRYVLWKLVHSVEI